MCNSAQVRIPVLALSLLALATLTSTGVSAVIPMSINYQGHLLDSDGNPVPNGTYDFVFRLYAAETEGNLLWTEEQLDVPVNGGLFQVNLGTVNEITPEVVTPSPSIDSFFDIWVEISVDGETMLPRTPLTSLPYALMTYRVNGDITTSPGSVSMEEQVGFNYQKIKWAAGGGESYGEMEASDGFSVTKAYDKATPQLYQSLAKKKSEGGMDSLLMMGLIESDTIWFSMAATDGNSTTSRIDKSSPQLFNSMVESGDGASLAKFIDKATPGLLEASMESGEGANLTKKVDQSSPLLFQSTVESSDGVTVTKRIDKSSPLLYQSLAMRKSVGGSDSLAMMGLIESDTIWFSMSASDGMAVASRVDKASPQLMQSMMQSGQGASITRRIDKASPILFQSLVESTDGVTISKEYDKATPQLAMLGAHYMDIEDADVGDSAMITIAADAAGVSMKQAIQDGDAALQAQLNTSTLPTEEVSLRMTSGGSPLPSEEICLSTGPGPNPAGMWMFTTGNLTPGAGPADTNFQVYATAEGGTLEMGNIGGTNGDGLQIAVSELDNAIRLRHGGANTGVYLESDPSTGGRIGVNNEAPTEALQVGGNICASGSIGVCSDLRFKENINSIPRALDKVAALRGVTFTWKQDEYPSRRFADGSQIGLVAQEVLEVAPEVVLKHDDGYFSVDYGKLTPLLIEAVKELKAQNEELRRRIESLEGARQ